jgi:hypothetical protein
MRIKRNSVKRLAMAVAVPGMALGTLAGFAASPALAGTAHPHQPAQYERISGFGNGGFGEVSVQANGAFTDFGYLNVNSGQYTTVHLSRGDLYVYEGYGYTTSNVRPETCAVTYRTNTEFIVYAGSGRYYGVHGYGSATITETGALPRKQNGQCNTNADPISNTVHNRVVADTELTLPYFFH